MVSSHRKDFCNSPCDSRATSVSLPRSVPTGTLRQLILQPVCARTISNHGSQRLICRNQMDHTWPGVVPRRIVEVKRLGRMPVTHHRLGTARAPEFGRCCAGQRHRGEQSSSTAGLSGEARTDAFPFGGPGQAALRLSRAAAGDGGMKADRPASDPLVAVTR